METKIKVECPNIDAHGLLAIRISANNGSESYNGIIHADFTELLIFANNTSKEVIDFFIISTCVYGIDRFVLRKEKSVNGWSRNLNVTIPVYKVNKWNSNSELINSTLSFLTGDYWDVKFEDTDFEIPFTKQKIDNSEVAQVNLFSGGLDSLIGAIDFLETNPTKKILLASHYDPQLRGPKTDQEDLLGFLNEKYKNKINRVPSIGIYLKKTERQRETTFRSRSILFIAIACLIEGGHGKSVIVPENGTVSLNYPLSVSRRSACSTRTTHPTLISNIEEIWQNIGINTNISNPYEFKTKLQMVENCKNPEFLSQIVSRSNSCGKRGHRAHWKGNKGASHCGVCMPCIYRMASLQNIEDGTEYGNSINNLNFLKKMGQDCDTLLEFLRKDISKQEIKNELLINGLKDLDRIDNYINVVVDTRGELKSLINKIGNTKVKKKAGLI